MPFKLLKKSRQYNVMSKDLFVITVVCLDGSNIDCTLSSESKGLECLENVCQRAGLNQSEFFGLKFIPKGCNEEADMRWVDLDRPLNRQLEKHAANSKILYLRIMYYILSGVSLITDEQTRNYYFLQLKQDIVEGRIICDAKQAIILANYGRQAEYGMVDSAYGNYQDRHKSIDYLKSLLSFPKALLMESGMLEVLTEEVIEHEHEVHDVPQGAAEELYISLCQQLDGYGQETFSARNEDNVEVMLGISVSGVIVGNGGSHKFYPWREIVNVVNHKRTFSIECTDPSQNVSFTLPDAENGRYIWKLCVSQHTFFMNYEQNHHTSQANLNLFQNVPEHFNESREDLLSSGDKIYFSNSQLAIPNSSTNLTVWHPSSESLLNTNPMESRTSLQASVVDLPNPTTVQNPQWNPAGSTENTSMINRAQSSSCVDLTNNNNNNAQQHQQQTNLSSSMNVSKERFLPKYRPAPSYEVAIQQKFRGSQTDVNLPLQQQLQSHQMTFDNFGHPSNAMSNIHAAQVHYPDVTHVTPHKNYFDASDYLSQRLKMLSLNPPQYPANRLSSTSTPDLALASHRGLFGYRQNNISSPDLVSSRTLIHPHAYIPPYAHSILYPYGGGGGTVIAGSGIGGGGNNNKHQKLRHSNSFLPHATYENLNFIETANPNFFPAKHIPNNLIYRTASSAAAQQLADMEYYLNKQQQQQHRNHSLNALNLSNSHISEPIYENVPLPLVKSSNALHTTTTNASTNEKTHHAVLIKPSPRIAQTAVRTNSAEESTDANLYTINKGSSKNISSDPLNGNENENNNNRMSQQKHYLLMNNDNNGNSILSGSTSITNINVSTSHDAHNKISVTVPAATVSSSPFHIENNLQEKQRFSKNHANASTTLPLMNISGASSNYTMNTTATVDTTDSGISTDGAGKKRNKFWNLLGKNKSSSASKQKSATLGREKEGKNKKDKSGDAANKEAESNMRHRWSTGLPRLQPLPANVSKEKLCQMLDAKLNDTQLFLEFERIPKRKENAQYSSALLEENQNKNVDSTCLPMDENRVKLIPTRENRIGYVNASHVSSTVGQKQRFYITAQSPSNAMNANIFWQCVWEADVYLIVQLSDEFIYVPPNSEKCLGYGQFQVWREFSQETNKITTSKLRIYHTQSRRYRSVWHLSFMEFNDQHCPKDVSQFLKFLEELNSVRLASISEVPAGHNQNPPVLIHCTNGENTGLTLVADLLLYTLDHNQDIDIPRVIGNLREQRDKMIPSLIQYKFIYALLIHYLRQTRLI